MRKQILIPSTFLKTSQPPNNQLMINVLGAGENLPPIMLDRPTGTGDFLLMQFHDPTIIGIDNNEQIYPKGTMIIWLPGVRQHYGYLQPQSKPWRHSWMHCNGKIIEQLVNQSRLPTNMPFGPLNTTYFDNAISEIHREHIGNHPPSQVIIKNIIQNCFIKIYREIKERNIIPTGLVEVKTYIDQHPYEAISLEQLAKIGKYSITHLSLLFRKHFGLSPIAYANQIRMQQAMLLLQDQNQTIGQIAESTGFSDIYHFSRRFKEYWGKSPTKLRHHQKQ